ncbi:MAG: hypothetical protein HRU41_41835 [Saprospiraceae bacterium]|nr:hypothetical protein [Saprospiraceae bacterium]
MTQPSNIQKITITAHGSYVYKAVIREVLGISSRRHYTQEINMLKREVEGFEIKYREGSNLVKVRLSVAIIIIQTILSRETGKDIEVEPIFQAL